MNRLLSFIVSMPHVFNTAGALAATASDYVSVRINNGTVIGLHNQLLQQDFFLGIPFAEPPIGGRRFSLPQPLSERWNTSLEATSYGPACKGYSLELEGFDQKGFPFPRSEDCLTLNVVRPVLSASRNSSQEIYPVLVWIYGGGFEDGASRDQRYNMSALVSTSVEMGMPIIGVSFNYRVAGWGFLGGSEVSAAGLANIGLHDQRMALQWIQENIPAFGGDPSRVTIQGESAGGNSVGIHLRGYAEHDKPPFRAAIIESAAPPTGFPSGPDEAIEKKYQAVLSATNCSQPEDRLACLRYASEESLDAIFSTQNWGTPGYVADDMILRRNTSIRDGDFVRVPLLTGTNRAEGTTFMLQAGFQANTSADVAAFLAPRAGRASNRTIDKLVEAYSLMNVTEELGSVRPDAYGDLFGVASIALADVLFDAPRRLWVELWDRYGLPAYSYRFSTIPAGVSPEMLGATHFQEVPFVFRGTSGLGYDVNPFAVELENRRERYEQLSELMARMWISFVTTLSPNNHGILTFSEQWPPYSENNPVNIVFDADQTPYLERDDYRAEPIGIMNDPSSGVY